MSECLNSCGSLWRVDWQPGWKGAGLASCQSAVETLPVIILFIYNSQELDVSLVHTHKDTNRKTHTHAHTKIHTHTRTCKDTHTHSHTQRYTHTHTHKDTPTRACAPTHTHTHTSIHARKTKYIPNTVRTAHCIRNISSRWTGVNVLSPDSVRMELVFMYSAVDTRPSCVYQVEFDIAFRC